MAVLGVLPVRAAQAEAECGSAGKPWVSLAFAENRWPEGFAEKVLADLRAGLTARGIDACLDANGSTPEPPLANVRVAGLDARSVAVVLDIRDAVTEKRVSRDVDLATVPADGRAFAVAIAIDELVWASWAEIALTRKQHPPPKKPARTVPREVVEGVTSELPRRGAPWRLGARFALEHYTAGETLLGGDAVILLPIAAEFALDFELGARAGLTTSAPDGQIRSSAFGGGAGLRYAFLRGRAGELGATLGVRAAFVRFRAEAEPGIDAMELSGLTLFARGGAFTNLRVAGPLAFDAAVGAGAPLRALEATDAGKVVTGVSGAELWGTFGFTVEL